MQHSRLLSQIMMPSQWSSSCWMISAVQPEKVLMRGWNFSFCHCTLMVCQRLVFRVPVRERQPSSVSYGPDFLRILTLECDDAFSDAYHVRCHADAAVFVGDERFQQVLRDGQVFRQGRRGFSGEKKLVFADVTNHIISASQEFRRRSHRWRGAFSAHPRLRPSWMPRRLSGRQRPVWLPAWLLLCRAS